MIEYSSNYSETTGRLWFYSKDEATAFNADIANTDYFKSFKYKAKLLRNTVAKLLENTGVQPAPNQTNTMFKYATVAVLLKYLRNFWKLFEMLLINCKVELTLMWTKYRVLLAAGAVNANDKSNNICFYCKGTKYMCLMQLYQEKRIKNYQNFIVKDLKDHFITMNIKQKARKKIGQMNIDIFSNEILLGSIDCFF